MLFCLEELRHRAVYQVKMLGRSILYITVFWIKYDEHMFILLGLGEKIFDKFHSLRFGNDGYYFEVNISYFPFSSWTIVWYHANTLFINLTTILQWQSKLDINSKLVIYFLSISLLMKYRFSSKGYIFSFRYLMDNYIRIVKGTLSIISNK